ncbi:hypothetical protein Trydic_g15634, partial [Trypoxylus dichotomus]
KIPIVYSAVVGSVSLKEGGVPYKVIKIVTHPKYTGQAPFKNDLALFKLDKEIETSDNVKIISLETRNVGRVSAVVSGWGLTSNFAIRPPDNLQYLQTRTISGYVCRFISGGDASQICTWNSLAQGVCYGDSGGPLVANGNLIGIVSYGMLACGSGIPSVYTRVSYFKGWIQSIIDKN